MPKQSLQPRFVAIRLGSSSTSVAAAPTAVPSQYDPFTRRSTVPRTLAGINSSMAELMAEYSPPMPIPVRNRRTKNHHASNEAAVNSVETK